MNGTSLYEEVQGFPSWTYALFALVLVVIVGAASLRMSTRVTSDAVTVRYGFLYASRVPLSEIQRAEAVVYRPVRDYGGWGIRGFGRRRALNARGNLGVFIFRRDGSTLLVGSQRPHELLEALARAGVPTEDKIPADVHEF
jgi:hypothetical protein